MLILSRKKGEKIHLGDDIVITVTEIRRGQTKLGFDAPKGLEILREELKLKQQQLRAELDAKAKKELLL